MLIFELLYILVDVYYLAIYIACKVLMGALYYSNILLCGWNLLITLKAQTAWVKVCKLGVTDLKRL